jgi:hypothetical protein
MPYYTIRNNQTNEVEDVFLSMSEKQTLLEENPHLEQIFTKAPMIGDPVHLGVKRIDSSFRNILKNVKKEHAHSTVKV